MHPRLFQLGSIAIPTAGVITAIAIVAALFTARITARRLELNPEKVWDLGIVGVLTALFAPRLILIFTNWKDFIAHPLWLIGVVRVRSEAATLGGMAVAIVVMCAFVFFTRMPFRRTLDALAPSLALGFAIASLGSIRRRIKLRHTNQPALGRHLHQPPRIAMERRAARHSAASRADLCRARRTLHLRAAAGDDREAK